MAKGKRSRAKRLVMDIGSSAVRLCELTPTKTGYQLTRYLQREFNIDPSTEEDEQQEVRVGVVREALKEFKARAGKAVIGLPGQSVFTRPRSLPPVPEYKVNQIVRYEILQQIPFSFDQIAFDYQVLKETDAGGYEVLMAAIKVDVVEKYVSVLRQVKKHPALVDVCPLAAYNWFKHSGEFGDQGDCVALVDLGASTTDIVIERDNQFRFPRSINFGGNDITSAIATEFSKTFEEAEQLKRERGFAPTGDPRRDGKGGEVIGRMLTRLVAEINRSFAYFRSQPGGGPVSRVIITGGGACLRNIVPYLQRQLGVEVRIAQPLSGLAIAPGAQQVNDHPEQAAVVLGLALRTCEPVPIEINLIPPRVREAARRKEQAFYYALSAVVFGLIMASIIPVQAQKSELLQERIEAVKQNIKLYDRSLVLEPGVDPGMWTSKYTKQLNAARSQYRFYKDQATTMRNVFLARRQWIMLMTAINEARLEALKEAARNATEAERGETKRIIIKNLESARIAPAVVETGSMPGWNPYTCTVFPGVSTDEDLPLGRAPNALVIRGLASDEDTLLAFLDALRQRGEFLGGGGVYFSSRDSDPADMSALTSESTAPATQPRGLTSGGRSDSSGGGLGRLANMAGASRQRQGTFSPSTTSSPALTPGNAPFRTFRIDLHFDSPNKAAFEKPRRVAATEGAQGAPGASAPQKPNQFQLKLNRANDDAGADEDDEE